MMETVHKPSNIKSNIQMSKFFRAVETGCTECRIYTHLSLLEMNVAPGNLQLLQMNTASQLCLAVPSLHVSFHFPSECQLFHLKTNKQTLPTIHKEKSNKMQQCIKFYYSIFI